MLKIDINGALVRIRALTHNPVGKAEVVSSILTGSTIFFLIDPNGVSSGNGIASARDRTGG